MRLHYMSLQALSVTHVRKKLPHACNCECSMYGMYGMNAENVKMADYLVLLSIAIFETKRLYEKRQIPSGVSTILSPLA